MPMPHRLDGTYTVHGHAVTVTVDPCSWMYPGYPLQVTCKGLRTDATVSDRSHRQDTATPEDVRTMLETQLTVEPCDTCGELHFFTSAGPLSNRGHTCEPCFLTKLEAEWKEEDAREKIKERKEDERRKRQGYTHKLVAWVHPPRGDDYQIVAYTKGAISVPKIASILRRRKSQVLDDYSLTPL